MLFIPKEDIKQTSIRFLAILQTDLLLAFDPLRKFLENLINPSGHGPKLGIPNLPNQQIIHPTIADGPQQLNYFMTLFMFLKEILYGQKAGA
jgi:hypothetical protein